MTTKKPATEADIMNADRLRASLEKDPRGTLNRLSLTMFAALGLGAVGGFVAGVAVRGLW